MSQEKIVEKIGVLEYDNIELDVKIENVILNNIIAIVEINRI